jgi:hypothetical protein
MVGYSHDASRYNVYNLVACRIITSVHLVFQEDIPGFGVSTTIDSLITDAYDEDSDHSHGP